MSHLSSSEIEALRSCKYWSNHGWGHREYGLGLSATIAKERGAEFKLSEVFNMNKYFVPVDKKSTKILGQAHRDLINEIGYNSEGKYLRDLDKKFDSFNDIEPFLISDSI